MSDPTLGEVQAQLAGHIEVALERWIAHERLHGADQRAVDIAARLAEQNRVAANEWRATLSDRERLLANRAEVSVSILALDGRIDSLERSDLARSTREGERERAQNRTMALIGILATIAGVVLSVLLRLLAGG